MSRRYYRRRNYNRRYNNNKNDFPFLFLVLAFIGLAFIAMVFRGLAILFTEYVAVVIAIIAVAIALLFIFSLSAYINQKYKKLALQSPNIKELVSLNQEYNFFLVENMDIKNIYDNENFYNDISEIDCLTYNLVYTKKRALDAISSAQKNARQFEEYMQKVLDFKNKMKSAPDKKVLFVNKYRRLEESIFNEKVLRPTVNFQIVVTVVRTNINGKYMEFKRRIFSSKKIEEIIDGINDNENGFYLNRDIWDSICRVERGKVTNKMRFAVYARDGNKCRYCGSRYNLEVDHIFPIAKGGKTTFDNLQTLCHDCNVKKSDTVTTPNPNTYHPKRSEEFSFCPSCKNGRLMKKKGKYGVFYGCSNYPDCKFVKKL